MGLRQGVTAAEENRLKHLISAGRDWDDIVGLIQGSIDATKKDSVNAAFLDGVDLATVKKNIYDPLVKKLAEAKKAGFETIHKHEADIKAKSVKKSTTEQLRADADDLRNQLDEANKKLAEAKGGTDDLIGKKKPPA